MVVSYTVTGDSIMFEKPRVWSDKQFTSAGLRKNYDLDADGKRVVTIMPAAASESTTQYKVTFILNFADEIRRRLSDSRPGE
jgi:hypothetical protein